MRTPCAFLLLAILQKIGAFQSLSTLSIARTPIKYSSSSSFLGAIPNPLLSPVDLIIPDLPTSSSAISHSLLLSSSTISHPLLSAFAAYTHYLGLILIVGALITERLTLCAPVEDQSESKFDLGSYADIVYGLAGVLVLVSGYFRVTEYGKGVDFYLHEPVFWVKMFLFSVMGAASFFPTTKVIQRAVAKKTNEAKSLPPPPMWSPKLVSRVTTLVNAELLAVGSIPLAATMMARGVGGNVEWLPWQLGLAPSLLAVGGLGFKYIREALDWEEPV